MAVSLNRASVSAETSENPLGRLTTTSLLIQSWYDSLQNLFFKKDGILVAQQGNLRKSIEFPFMIVYCQPRNLDDGEDIQLFMQSYELNENESFNKWKFLILSHINKIKNFLLNWNSNNAINMLQIIVMCKNPSDGLEETHSNIDKFQVQQLIISLLHLYKDIVATSSFMFEDSKLMMIKELLELSPKTDDKKRGCEALKEMMRILKEEAMSLDDSLMNQDEDSYMANSPRQIYTVKDLENLESIVSIDALMADHGHFPFFNVDGLGGWMQNLSNNDFIYLVVRKGNILSRIALQDALEKRSISVLGEIMVQNPMLLLKYLPLSLVHEVLKKMLKEDFIMLFQIMPIDTLLHILTKMPTDLLKNVLLEIPTNILCALNLKIVSTSLREKINQCLAVLKTTYQLRQDMLEVSERKVPSLLSLAVTKICQASNRCLVGKGASPLSSTYVHKMNLLYPDLQSEVYSQLRLTVNIPIIDDMPQFTVEGPQGEGYLPELDLFPLASMVPGYNDFIRKTLLEKCGDN